MKVKFILFFALTIFISGCKEENLLSKQEVKSVEYYKNNQEERKSVLEECVENPGKYENNPNCKNAKAAELQSYSGRDNSNYRF